MKTSHRLSDAVHILAYMVINQGGDLSSTRIASSIQTNPSSVRTLMSDMRKAGLISTRSGAVEPQLTRPASAISLYDIFMAISMDHSLLHIDPNTNMACMVGANIQAVLQRHYAEINSVAEEKMKTITLASIVSAIEQEHAKKMSEH